MVPPSTNRFSPITNEESSLARNRIALAASSGRPGVDEDVELLAHVQRHSLAFDLVDDLEHPRVDALCAIARE